MLGRLRTLRTRDYRAAPGRLAFSPHGWRDCQWWGVDRRPRHDQRQRHANFRAMLERAAGKAASSASIDGVLSHTVAGADRRHYGGDRAVPHARRDRVLRRPKFSRVRAKLVHLDGRPRRVSCRDGRGMARNPRVRQSATYCAPCREWSGWKPTAFCGPAVPRFTHRGRRRAAFHERRPSVRVGRGVTRLTVERPSVRPGAPRLPRPSCGSTRRSRGGHGESARRYAWIFDRRLASRGRRLRRSPRRRESHQSASRSVIRDSGLRGRSLPQSAP